MSIVLVLLFPALGFAGAGLLAHNIWRKETQDRATTFNGPSLATSLSRNSSPKNWYPPSSPTQQENPEHLGARGSFISWRGQLCKSTLTSHWRSGLAIMRSTTLSLRPVYSSASKNIESKQ